MPRRRRFASSAGSSLHNSAKRLVAGGDSTVTVTTVQGTSVLVSGDYTANAEVAVGDLVELESTNTVRKARPDQADPKQLIGFCVEKTGSNCKVQYGGEFTFPVGSPALQPEGTYFARSNGTISTTAPTGGLLYVVGRARNSSTIIITIAEPIHLS